MDGYPGSWWFFPNIDDAIAEIVTEESDKDSEE